MKKYLLLILGISISLTALATSPIEQHIRKHESDIRSLEIIEEGPKDSLYTPFRTLLSAKYFYSKCTTICVTADANSYDSSKSTQERIRLIKNAIDEVKNNLPDGDIFINAIVSAESPFMGNKYNRIGQRVKYRLNGILQERVFIYNEDGKDIGHTDFDNMREAKKTLEAKDEFQQAFTELAMRLQEL